MPKPTLCVMNSGRVIDLAEPTPEEISIFDIAHHLSMICRFNGATDGHYSVAQHSVFVSNHIDPAFALVALMHDAPEAYMGDIARPVQAEIGKHNVDPIFIELWGCISEKFGLPARIPPQVDTVDNRALVTEARDLIPNFDPRIWPDAEPYPDRIIALPASAAELAFRRRFKQLTQEASA